MNLSNKHKTFGTTCRTFFIIICGLLASCQDSKPVQFQGKAQGTYYSIIYYDSQHRNFQPQIDSLLDAFDQTASLWVENSLLRRINRNDDSVLNADLERLIDLSLQMNSYTAGAFDCTVGKLVNAWGFGFSNREDMSQAKIDSLRQFTGTNPEIVHRDGLTLLRKPFPEQELDFNAIAQGYAVDLIGEFLANKGISDFLIDLGGEVLAKGCKPHDKPWKVGIERPAETKYSAQEVEVAIELNNQSVVTSGNYRKYYEKDGVKYSHTINPETGRPVEHSLLSASVLAPESWQADALATAFMVMGLEKSLEFLKEHPEIEGAYFIYDQDGEYKTFATPGFEKKIIKQ